MIYIKIVVCFDAFYHVILPHQISNTDSVFFVIVKPI